MILLFVNCLQAQNDSIIDMFGGSSGKEKSTLLLHLSKENWYSNPRSSIQYARQAGNIGTQLGDDTLRAKALGQIGSAYYFLQIPDSAVLYLKKALHIYKTIGNKHGISITSNNLGLLSDYTGDYELAIHYYFQSLKIDKELGDKKGIAATYLNIATVYHSLVKYEKALDYMLNSLGMYKELNDSSGILKCYTNIGSTYTEIGILENAMEYSVKALKMSRKTGNKDLEAANLNNIGKTYFILKDYRASIDSYEQALIIEQEMNDRWSVANTLRNIAVLYIETGNSRKGLANLNKSYEIAIRIEAQSLLMEIYSDYSYLYEGMENYQKALFYHKKFDAIHDSIINKETELWIAQTEADYMSGSKSSNIIHQSNPDRKTSNVQSDVSYILMIFGYAIAIVLVIALIIYMKKNSHLIALVNRINPDMLKIHNKGGQQVNLKRKDHDTNETYYVKPKRKLQF